jgi:hypothetical protein
MNDPKDHHLKPVWTSDHGWHKHTPWDADTPIPCDAPMCVKYALPGLAAIGLICFLCS